MGKRFESLDVGDVFTLEGSDVPFLKVGRLAYVEVADVKFAKPKTGADRGMAVTVIPPWLGKTRADSVGQ